MKIEDEKKFTTEFGLWIKDPKNKPVESEAYELKHTKGGTFNLNTWKKESGHQPVALHDASCGTGEYKKISDQSSDQKPFDAFYLVNAKSYLVIYFEKYNSFFKIPFDDVLEFIDQTSVSYEYLMKTQTEQFLPQKRPAKRLCKGF